MCGHYIAFRVIEYGVSAIYCILVGGFDIHYTTTKQETLLFRTWAFYVGAILHTLYNAFVSWNMQDVEAPPDIEAPPHIETHPLDDDETTPLLGPLR
jgi:hypothetical protein